MAPALIEERLPAGWWPVDRLIAGYLAAVALLIVPFWRRVPEAPWLLAAHVAGIALIVAAAKARSHKAWLHAFRHWYPLPYVAACYKEMALLIPAIRATDLDAAMARLDARLWGAHPTVWLERLANPYLTEILQLAYSLFVPAVLAVPWLLWRRRDYVRFRYCAFVVSIGFLASYAGYLLVPVRGPRFFLAGLQHFDLRGLWLFSGLQETLNRLESAHYDCFPSGHTELTLLAWWTSRWISPNLFRGFSVYSAAIVFATVYLRYHYTVDVFAGAAVAGLLWWLSPRIYGWGVTPRADRCR